MSINRRRSSLNFGERMMFLAGILFCLVLITTAMMSGLFARYLSTDDSGDNARVAAFRVNVNGPEKVTVKYGVNNDTGEYILTIDNQSEVAVSYRVRVELKDVNFGIIVGIGEKTLKNTTETVGEYLMSLDFGKVGDLPPKGDVQETIKFYLQDWDLFTKDQTGASRMEEKTFILHVDVVQVD